MKQKLISFLLLFALAQVTMGQEPVVENVPKKRPKVALVLSGGGAKGMAHIGVIKVLEKAGMPIDIITGTSMGSIIGGLYACGNNGTRLDSIVRAQDWTYVLSDREDLSHQSLLEREKQNTYVISKNINFGKGPTIEGGGVIIGKNIMTLFDALTAPYNDSIDFNTLPIPFACVATNIIDNTEYDFHSGVLSQAMRASMSIPAAFSPVRVGDKVLVDGGLRNNFPADIAKEMGADYIIGVSVQGEPRTSEDINSSMDLISQIVDVNCKNKYQENWDMTDVPIRVNVKPYGAASFSPSAVDTLIRRGEEAAMAHWDEIIALRDKIGYQPRPRISKRISTVRVPLPVTQRYKIDKLEFVNMSKNDESFIRSKFRLHEGDTIDADRADIITTSIRQDLYYKTAKFRFFNNEDHSGSRVVFTAGDKKSSQLSVGIRFDTEETVALQANAEVPLRTKIPMDLDFTLRLGKRILSQVDWSVHPRSFFRPTFRYAFRRNDLDLYDYGDKAFSVTYDRHSLKAALFNFNIRNFSVSLGAIGDYYHIRSLLVDQSPEHIEDFNTKDKGYISYFGTIDYNSENEWYFPTRGARFRARFVYYTDDLVKLKGEAGFRDYTAVWRMSFPINNHISVQPMLYGRLLCGNNIPLLLGNVIGGEWLFHYVIQQLPFAGIGNLQTVQDKFLAAQLQTQINITQNNIVLLRVAGGQNADKFGDLLKHRTMLGGSISYYYNMLFGPLGGTIGYSNVTKDLNLYINLGFVF